MGMQVPAITPRGWDDGLGPGVRRGRSSGVIYPPVLSSLWTQPLSISRSGRPQEGSALCFRLLNTVFGGSRFALLWDEEFYNLEENDHHFTEIKMFTWAHCLCLEQKLTPKQSKFMNIMALNIDLVLFWLTDFSRNNTYSKSIFRYYETNILLCFEVSLLLLSYLS